MKKFTFMLLAAFIAVTAMATGLEKRQALNLNSVATTSVKQVTPKAKAAKVQMSAVENLKKVTNKAKANVRKAPKKAGIADLLSVDWMLCSYYYEYDSEAGSLVESTPAAGGTPVSFSIIDEQTVAINGFTSDATEAIQGTVAVTTDEELLAEGVIAEISIADGQTLLESDYGPVLLANFSGENEGDPITAYVYSDGYVEINSLWADVLGGDGEYAGYLWSGYYHSSFAVPVNGKMTWTKSNTENEVPVVILQDPEAPKYVTVYNFAGEQTAIVVTMKEDNSFTIESQFVVDGGSTYGEFYTYATDGNYVSAIINGTGTEETLTFNDSWTLFAPTTGYWYGLFNPATITLLDGSTFIYPVIPDVAAMPADPSVFDYSAYDSSYGYGRVRVDIPVTDVDGNDLKESKLYYILYSDIEGEIAPITFTPDLYKNLEADLTEIPYTFNDGYDFDISDGHKVVYLNYDFSDYNRIGVQSVYYGGEAVNATEIQWFTIKEYTTGDFTFNFNEMDVATSSNVSTDGDITETLELTEGSVKLAISPKEEGKTTENRFWSTNNGPQLRVYSGTLTFTVPKGYVITSITFNHNGKWGSNTVDGEVIPNDADAKVATWTGSSQTVVVTIAANTQIDQITVTVVEAPEVAATPAAPAFDSLVLVGTTYPKLYLNVPTVDVDEYPINTEKLYYTIWYELADGKAQQFVVKADEYESITEDMVEVPYTYGDNWDIYEGGSTFYLNPADFDYTAWKRIGVQSIYYGADERRESEITWITPVSVTSAKYATFYAPVDVDFTGNAVSAYAATFDGEYVQLAPVTTVPAGTAVVVKAEAAGTYVVNETTDAVLGATNELLAATVDVVADGTQYVLAKVDDVVGFYKVNTGSTIAAGKGYMVFETAVKPFYAFGEDDATGISGIVADENAVIYNLAGQRVSKAVKGINIINGKKVLK